ncbi:M23 family metallopeptidase [Aquimarina pacifica]|uniref:M23 family metallopeptidase n=1 Tax=Aquimarina pacifica TaxID=1296415 RepID=UPI001377FC9B|nr:M23 family metallopeptidase [Aquimarina pacifica]
MKKITLLLCIVSCMNLYCQTKAVIFKTKKNSDKSLDIIYEKSVEGNYTAIVEFTGLENVSDRQARHICKIKGQRGLLLKLRAKDPEKSITYDSYRTVYIRGRLKPKVNKDYIYNLPFKKGKTVKSYNLSNVSKKYFGSKLPTNWKAYGFKAKDTDTVVSIRKGTVVRIKEDHHHELDSISSYTSESNKVYIEHKDGTIARYSGFIKNGVLVQPGDKVLPNTPIGIMPDPKKTDKNMLKLTISYLSSSEFRKTPTKLKDKVAHYTYITPKFLTTEGILELEPKKEYTSDFTEEILFSEFSKREKKKYMANK